MIRRAPQLRHCSEVEIVRLLREGRAYMEGNMVLPVVAGASPAIASVGNLGTGNHITSSNNFTFTGTTAAAFEIGNVAMAVFATDNTTTTNGSSSDHTTLTIGGVGMTKLKEWTHGGGGTAGGGATVSIWHLRHTAQINSGAAIAATITTARVAKAVTIWEFTSGDALTFNDPSGWGSETQNAADPGSIALSGLTNREYLFFRGQAMEHDNTTNWTPTANYTVTNISVADAGAAAAGMRALGEFRIITATGETSNPTTALTVDTAGLFIALYEAGVAPPEPLAPDPVSAQQAVNRAANY